MTLVVQVLILLLMAALSAPLAKTLAIPLPLVQIGLGVLANMAGLQVEFDPELFMLLFIPPLLFSDAFVVSKRAFFELRRVIFALAVGLVVFSTLAGGAIIHLLLSALPVAACLALSAILSPTDAVAVGGMLAPGSVPRRFLHIVQGEALLNDASGLVCFKFAILAAMTGTFSPTVALLDFLFISAGGIVFGVAIGAVFVKLDRLLVLPAVSDAATQTVLLMLMPFAAYLAAERAGVSGILASVATGFTVSQMRLFGITDTRTRLTSDVVLAMVGFVFNGLIFLLLGLQLPHLVEVGHELGRSGRYSSLTLPIVIVAITLGLVALRFVWIWCAIGVRCLLARAAGGRYRIKTGGFRSAAMSVAGVRGAVTLAGVLTLPVATGRHGGFPDRDVLVVVAAGVIVASIVLASVCLPWLLSLDKVAGDLPDEDGGGMRRSLAQAALGEIERVRAEAYQGTAVDDPKVDAATTLFHELNRRLEWLSEARPGHDRLRQDQLLEFELRLRILATQRRELLRLSQSGRITMEAEREVTRELDFEEELVLANHHRLNRVNGVAALAVEKHGYRRPAMGPALMHLLRSRWWSGQHRADHRDEERPRGGE